jgi:putative restriction endonuclease
MAHAVFIQNPRSIYKDRPGVAYHFPRRYLGMVNETIGDWVIFYEGRQGAFGYTAVQKVRDVTPDLDTPDHFYAWLDPASAWSFERIVPRENPDGLAFEHSLRGVDGKPTSGGVNVSAVRRLTSFEFAQIVDFGLQATDGPEALPRNREVTDLHPGFADPATQFDAAPLTPFRPEILMSRKFRDASFARQVKVAYGYRCAISGLSLRNGGGRPEVEAAHIRPVSDDGPDHVRNGLALSGTLHWMFDRGLISVADDLSVLVSDNKVPRETAQRLIAPERRLFLPEDARLRPHPDYLRYHRETIFGQGNPLV